MPTVIGKQEEISLHYPPDCELCSTGETILHEKPYCPSSALLHHVQWLPPCVKVTAALTYTRSTTPVSVRTSYGVLTIMMITVPAFLGQVQEQQ